MVVLLIALILSSSPIGGNLGLGLNGIFKIFCFTGDTPVWVAELDGKGGFRYSTKPIARIKQGDLVVSRNPRNNQVEVKKVTATSRSVAPEIFKLELADSAGRVLEVIKTTRDHPFFVKEKGWSQASRLGIGTSIVTRAGPELTVKRITRIPRPEGVEVYNFSVEDHHTYFVGKTFGGAWVHNSRDCTAFARRQLNDAGDGWVIRAEPPPSASNLGISGWAYHDAYISSEGVARDGFRKLGPMSVDEWVNTFPFPDATSVRYITPDELFSKLYRGLGR